MIAAPVAVAEDDDAPPEEWPERGNVGDICYEINPYNFPPVAVYECDLDQPSP